jgi:hypothetical protein
VNRLTCRLPEREGAPLGDRSPCEHLAQAVEDAVELRSDAGHFDSSALVSSALVELLVEKDSSDLAAALRGGCDAAISRMQSIVEDTRRRSSANGRPRTGIPVPSGASALDC